VRFCYINYDVKFFKDVFHILIVVERVKYGSIQLPVWYLDLEKRYLKHSARKGFLLIFLFIAVYAFIPILNAEPPITTIIPVEMIVLYYLIFFIFYFIALYVYYKFLFKPYKIKPIEILAYEFYKIGIYLEEINFDLTLDIKLKKHIGFLITDLKNFKRKYSTTLDTNYETRLETVMDNIRKLNDFKTDKVKNMISYERLADRFFNIGETLKDTKDYSTIQKQVYDLGAILEDVPKIKRLERYAIDSITIFLIASVIILVWLSFTYQESQVVFSTFIGAIVVIIFSRMFGKSNF